MDYRRLIGILILGAFIVYINQTIREGLESTTPPPPTDKSVLSDLPAPSMSCSVENFAPSE